MSDDQRAALLAKAEAGTPLYLLVALEELRTLGTYEEITDRIAQLPPDTRALFIWILKRLEDDDGFRDASGRKIGQTLVSRFVSLLGASRHGLSQQEFVELLSPGDPQGNVAALVQLLRPYLMQRGELLDFYHGQFREAAATSYLPSESQRHAAHDQLATYYHAQDYFLESVEEQRARANRLPPTPRPTNLRKVVELPWQRLKLAQLSGQWDTVETLLTDLPFLEAKAEAGMVFDLANDFRAARCAIPEQNPSRQILHQLENALCRDIHFISRHPTAIFQYMLDTCAEYICAERRNSGADSEHAMKGQDWSMGLSPPVLTVLLNTWKEGKHSRMPQFFWLQSLAPTHGQSVQVDAESPFKSFALAQIIRTDGIRSLSIDIGWNQAVTGDNSGFLSVWNLQTGLLKWRFGAHAGPVIGVGSTRDGRRAVSVSEDGTLRLWDIQCAAELMVVKPGTGHLGAVALTGGGVWCYCGATDGTITRWDLRSGVIAGIMTGHAENVWALDLCGSGLVSASNDRTLRVWDTCNRPVAVLRGHKAGVSGVAGSEGSYRAVASSFDGTLTVWNLKTNQKDRDLVGHNEEVMSVATNQDGSIALSGSVHGSLKVWNTDTGDCLQTIHGHSGAVHAISLSADGARAASCSTDGSLRIWQLQES